MDVRGLHKTISQIQNFQFFLITRTLCNCPHHSCHKFLAESAVGCTCYRFLAESSVCCTVWLIHVTDFLLSQLSVVYFDLIYRCSCIFMLTMCISLANGHQTIAPWDCICICYVQVNPCSCSIFIDSKAISHSMVDQYCMYPTSWGATKYSIPSIPFINGIPVKYSVAVS